MYYRAVHLIRISREFEITGILNYQDYVQNSKVMFKQQKIQLEYSEKEKITQQVAVAMSFFFFPDGALSTRSIISSFRSRISDWYRECCIARE